MIISCVSVFFLFLWVCSCCSVFVRTRSCILTDNVKFKFLVADTFFEGIVSLFAPSRLAYFFHDAPNHDIVLSESFEF